jgi:hypothetical protein
MVTELLDGSLLDKDGKMLVFSIKRFIEDIAEGDKCFICGATRLEKQFNDEHVLPNWILRKYSLHNRAINLPNFTQLLYSKYKIPCCKSCNLEMSNHFEQPISRAVNGGYDKVVEFVQQGNSWKLYCWLSLIFTKTHLKDKFVALNQDKRNGSENISDIYNWNELHHVHCIARSFYTNAEIDHGVLGSCFVLPAKVSNNYEDFGFRDLYEARTILLRLHDTCFIAVLNDSGASANIFEDKSRRLSGPLSPIQLQEIMAYLAYYNLCLKNRPLYKSMYSLDTGYHISADLPKQLELDYSEIPFGKILYACTEDILASLGNNNLDEIIEHVKNGRFTFLFDQSGNFINDSMEMAAK